MLKSSCTHAELLRALALCGHGDKLLIADGNYPLDSRTSETCQRVYLNLMSGIPLVTDVLEALRHIVPFEAVQVMRPDGDAEPAVYGEFEAKLPGLALERLDRDAFYAAAADRNVRLAIATGDARLYANLLLTVGTA